MKKVLLLATAALLVSGISFAQQDKKKKCAKGKSCCQKKSCSKDKKEKTADIEPKSSN
jgi:hypothetical protein